MFRIAPRIATLHLSLAVVFLAHGCETSNPSPLDASTRDATTVDAASTLDADAFDAGEQDADAMLVDAAVEDRPDAGPTDAGVDCRRPGAPVTRCCSATTSSRATCDTASGAWSCEDPDATVFGMEPWQSCGRTRVDHESDVEAGVPCRVGSEALCPLGSECVRSIVTSCEVSPSGRTHYRIIACDGPEDCGDARCCLFDERSASALRRGDQLYRTECAASCEGADAQMCNADADCPEGEQCCAGPSLMGGVAGQCQPACFE